MIFFKLIIFVTLLTISNYGFSQSVEPTLIENNNIQNMKVDLIFFPITISHETRENSIKNSENVNQKINIESQYFNFVPPRFGLEIAYKNFFVSPEIHILTALEYQGHDGSLLLGYKDLHFLAGLKFQYAETVLKKDVPADAKQNSERYKKLFAVFLEIKYTFQIANVINIDLNSTVGFGKGEQKISLTDKSEIKGLVYGLGAGLKLPLNSRFAVSSVFSYYWSHQNGNVQYTDASGKSSNFPSKILLNSYKWDIANFHLAI